MAIEKRKFGNTGHKSSAVIFGAAALWNETQSTSDRVLDLLFKYDINHIDVANIYGNAELRIGPWMKNYRKNFFLATKQAIAVSSTSFHLLSSSPHKLLISSRARGPCSPPSNSICLSR